MKQIQLISNTKNSALSELDAYDNIRAVISVMRYDINQAFHILYNDLGADAKQDVLANKPTPHTLFDGRKKELVFTSLSHRVYYTNVRECSQSEISYFLQPQKNGLPTLMKRESGFIDADLYQGGQIYSMLENVSDFQLQYWDDKIGKWVDDWNSDAGDMKDRFPFAVKIKLSVTLEGRKPLSFDSEFKLDFTNNTPLLVQF